jgi:MFS family permease
MAPERVRLNVGLLAACQAMLLSTSSTLIAVNGLVGLALAPYPGLATLPVTFWVLGGAAATLPASFHMKRVGRRQGLSMGALWAFAGLGLCAASVWFKAFPLLCLGTFLCGVFNAYGQYYRFAAADTAPADFKSTAISLVLAGGLVGGLLGPNLSRFTVDLLEPRFMAAYLVVIGYAAATIGFLRFVDIPNPPAAAQAGSGRPLREIAAQPKFIVAVLAGCIGYGVMNFLMTSTPLAMQVCGHAYGDSAMVISAHVIGMFSPSFITGTLIKRFGTLTVMLVGALLNFACIGIALSGITVAHFWWALVLLGVGWNFLYTGGTTLLTETYRPEEKAKAQGANDQAIFIVMVVSSLVSGWTVTQAGWARVNLFAAPLILIVACAIVWYALQSRKAAPA